MKKIILLFMLIVFAATSAFAADDTGGASQNDTPNLLEENYLDDDYEDTREELYTIEEIYDPLEPVNRV
ncbi:MAG TPA: hypothetical protein VJ969_10095, partial [Desulfopila sp.]|nr:hypothetical protein [Desulfopila sp.]